MSDYDSGKVAVTSTPPPSAPSDVNVVSSVEIEIKNDSGNPVPVSGTVAVSNFPATQPVSGTVNIGTMPEVEVKNDSGNPVPISDAGESITVDGTVSIDDSDKEGQFSLDIGSPIDENDFDVSGRAGISIQLTGTWTGLLLIYGSVDGETFQPWDMWDRAKSDYFYGADYPTIAIGDIAGLKKMRVTSVTTGICTVTWRAVISSQDIDSIALTAIGQSRADTFIVTGDGVVVNSSKLPRKYYTLVVKKTGAVTSWDVRLEGSLDNVKYTQILQHTNTTGDGVAISLNLATPYLYFKTRCAGLVLGAGTNIIADSLGVI
jgi:hypothetical protein